MKRFFASLAATAILMTASAAHAGQCYSRAQAEAEQGIRIHSELMVIGLNCQGMKFSDGTNLYAKYRDFTAAHADLFAQYEQELINYYKKQGIADPVAELNRLRTNLANKISLDSANMQPHIFCNRYANRVMKVQGMDKGTLRQWASTSFPSHPVSQPSCEEH